MKFRCSIWILWTTLACTTAPNIEESACPPALSFIVSSTRIYELEDIPALIWRNNDKLLTDNSFYFFYTIFACPEAKVQSRAIIEKKSITKSMAFVGNVLEPEKVRKLETHPLICQKMKKYHASAVSITRLNDKYHVIDPKKEGNRSRQEFSIGYEVADDGEKLEEKGLPPMERFEGLAQGFGWLEAFKVVYDMENFIARQVSYELNFLGVSETAPGTCKAFEVANLREVFKDICFMQAYRITAQIGIKGTMYEFLRPKRPQSQSTRSANGTALPFSSAQKESKKLRLGVQPEGSQTCDDELFDIDKMEVIHIDPAPWDSEKYLDKNSLNDSNNANATIPSGESLKSTKRPRRRPGAFDEQSEEYMVMQQLAPIEYFDVFTIQWSTCTHFNVVPMWRSLASGPWKRVDQSIRKMLYVIDKLSIIAGTHGALQLSKRDSPNEYETVFLRSLKTNIAIPELFYKFVVHKVPFPVPSSASWSFGIIIVMHNNFGIPTRKICPDDPDNLCFDYGWDVGSEDDEIARPYCCKPTPATLTALDITSYSSNFGYLDLNSVVIRFTGDGQNDVRNYNQFQLKQYPVVAQKKGKTKKLNDIYF